MGKCLYARLDKNECIEFSFCGNPPTEEELMNRLNNLNSLTLFDVPTFGADASAASAGIIDVNTGQAYATITDAINGSNDGDTIDIPAGIYIENFPKITHSLILQGVGG